MARVAAHVIADGWNVDFLDEGKPQVNWGELTDPANESGADLTDRHRLGNLERETGLEPATLSLGRAEEDEEEQ